MPSRSDTPTPGDLSARLQHLIDASECTADADTDADATYLPVPIEVFLTDMRAAIAALSALPAGGAPEPVGTVMSVTVDDFGEDLAHVGWHRPVPMVGTKLYTTPPADAHPDDGCLDCLRKERGGPADAAVGAQGEEAQKILADAIRLASDGVSFNTPADAADWMREALSAAPAAGKGVDSLLAKWRRDADNASSETAYAALAPMHEALRAEATARRRCAEELEAALTRQPVAGDGWRPIESAPKDVDVLVYCPGAPLPHRVAMLCLRVNSGKTVWLDTNSDRLAFPPTHWQPLDRPTGPAQGDGADTPADGGEG